MTACRTCVVILNWNQPDLTGGCLEAVLAQRASRFDVLVIDNGSTVDNFARLEAACRGRCQVSRLNRNQGFAGGMNVGIRHAHRYGYGYVWLLNNDTVPEADCLHQLIAALDASPRLALVTPRLHGADGVEQHAGGVFEWAGAFNRPLSAAEFTAPTGFGSWLTGTALLGRATVLAEAGGFDGRLFAYWEDVDLCFRLASAGHPFRAVPAARCLHLGGGSTGSTTSPFAHYMCSRNGWHVLRNWATGTNGLFLRLSYAARGLELAADYYAVGDRERAVAIAAGMFAAVRGEVGEPAHVPRLSRWWALLLWLASVRRCRNELNRLNRLAGGRVRWNRVRHRGLGGSAELRIEGPASRR
jgi:GT2 family glycosyltransferase